jgi:hypothetical protein
VILMMFRRIDFAWALSSSNDVATNSSSLATLRRNVPAAGL